MMIRSQTEKNQEQFTLNQQSRSDAEREFQQAHKAFFQSTSEAEYQSAIMRMDKARTELILNFAYSLEDLARLIDEGDAA